MTIYEELLLAAQTKGFAQRKVGEAVTEYLCRLIRSVHIVSDETWNSLTEPTQTWYNTAAQTINGGGEVSECPGFTDAPAVEEPVAGTVGVATVAPKAEKPAKPVKQPKPKQAPLPSPIPNPETSVTGKAPRAKGVSEAVRELIVLHPDWGTVQLRTQLVADSWDESQLKTSTLSTLRTDTLSTIKLIKTLGFWRGSEPAA